MWTRRRRPEEPRELKEINKQLARDERLARESEERLNKIRDQWSQVHKVSRTTSGYIERNGIADALRTAIGGQHG